ncbi:MAG: hypothetical protein Q8K86_10530, partial [Candidatus Nanopelagicaceae bacterium]|nr:hypothetical protein [Candidatus Nanopelagicaceae bacterium]
HNGYHNSPRIMRLVECIFDWSATVPDWWKEAKGRARDLARRVKKSINDFFKDMAVKASDQLSFAFETQKPPATLKKKHGTWSNETILEVIARENRACFRTVKLAPGAGWWNGGYYIRNCEPCRDSDTGGRVQGKGNYSGLNQS